MAQRFAGPADCGRFARALLAQHDKLPPDPASRRSRIAERIRLALEEAEAPLVLCPLGPGGQQKSTTLNELATGRGEEKELFSSQSGSSSASASASASAADPFSALLPRRGGGAFYGSGARVQPRYGLFPLPTGSDNEHVTMFQFRLRGAEQFAVQLEFEEDVAKVRDRHAQISNQDAREGVPCEDIQKDFAAFKHVDCGLSVEKMAETTNALLALLERNPLAVNQIVLLGPWRFYNPDPNAQKWELVDIPGKGAESSGPWQRVAKKLIYDRTIQNAHIAAVFSNRVPDSSVFTDLAASGVWTAGDGTHKHGLRVFVHFSQHELDSIPDDVLPSLLDETSSAFRRMLMAQTHQQQEKLGLETGSVPWAELAQYCTAFPRPWLTTSKGRATLFEDLQKRALDVYTRELHSLSAALIFNVRQSRVSIKVRKNQMSMAFMTQERKLLAQELEETRQLFHELLPERLEKYPSALKSKRELSDVAHYLELMIGLSFNLYSDSVVDIFDKFLHRACRRFDMKHKGSVSASAENTDGDADDDGSVDGIESSESYETAYYAVCAGGEDAGGEDGWNTQRHTCPKSFRDFASFAYSCAAQMKTQIEEKEVGDLAIELAHQVMLKFQSFDEEIQAVVDKLLQKYVVEGDTSSISDDFDGVVRFFQDDALPQARKQMSVFRTTHVWSMDDPITLSDYCNTINLAKSLRKSQLKKRSRKRAAAIDVQFTVDPAKLQESLFNFNDTLARECLPYISLAFCSQGTSLTVDISDALKSKLESFGLESQSIAPMFMPSAVVKSADVARLNLSLSHEPSMTTLKMLDGRRGVLFILVRKGQLPWYQEHLSRSENLAGIILVSLPDAQFSAAQVLKASKALAEGLRFRRIWIVGHLLKDFKQWNALAVRSESCTAARVLLLIQQVLDRVGRAPFEALKLRFDEKETGFNALLAKVKIMNVIGRFMDKSLVERMEDVLGRLSATPTFTNESWKDLSGLVYDIKAALDACEHLDESAKGAFSAELTRIIEGETVDTLNFGASVGPGSLHHAGLNDFEEIIEHSHIAGCVTPLPRFQSYAQLDQVMQGGFSTVFTASGSKSDPKGVFNGLALINVEATHGVYFGGQKRTDQRDGVSDDLSAFYRDFNASIGNALARFWQNTLGHVEEDGASVYFSKVRLAAWACASTLDLTTTAKNTCKICKTSIESGAPAYACHNQQGGLKPPRAHSQCYLQQAPLGKLQALEALELVCRKQNTPMSVPDLVAAATPFWRGGKSSLHETLRRCPNVLRIDHEDRVHHKDFSTFLAVSTTPSSRKRKAKAVSDSADMPPSPPSGAEPPQKRGRADSSKADAEME